MASTLYPKKNKSLKQKVTGGISAPAKASGTSAVGSGKALTPAVGAVKPLPALKPAQSQASAAGSKFQERFKKLGTPARHQLVEKVMAKKFGKTDWREKIYGKNYKGGTVKGLNKDIKGSKEKSKRITSYLKEAQANLAKTSGNTANKSKVESRLKELEATKKKTAAVTEHKKDKRQTYLDRRNKALENIQATAKKNPSALKAGRKRLAEQKMNEVKKTSESKDKKKKKSKATTTGGTEAP